jgi:uncharacterized membrane protein YeaQ/YmgE (transglycosylase-associated protein family)
MTILEVLILLGLAAVCGFLAQAIAGYARGGLIVAIVVGFVGALLGLWFYRTYAPPELFVITVDNQPFPIVWSIIGATLFMVVIGIFTRRRVYY